MARIVYVTPTAHGTGSQLPSSPLFDLASRCDVFISDGDVWLPAPAEANSRLFVDSVEPETLLRSASVSIASKGLYAGREKTICLVQATTLETLDAQYLNSNSNTIETYIAASVASGCTAAYPAQRQERVSKAIEEVEQILFIYNRLLPRIRQLRGEADVPPPFDADELSALVSRASKANDPELARGQFDISSTWSSLVSNFHWAIIDQKLCVLEPTDSPRVPFACLGGTIYAIHRQDESVSDLSKRWKLLMCAEIEEQCRSTDSLAGRIEVNRAVLDAARRIRKQISQHSTCDSSGRRYVYDSPTWCVFRPRKRFTWSLGYHVGPYVVEECDGSLYRMDETIVYVPIHPKRNVCWPRVADEDYDHPFVAAGGTKICMGSYPDTHTLRALKSMNREDQLLQVVLDARQVLLAGYHQHSDNYPFRRPSTFRRRLITREQAEKQGLPIYPYFRGQRK